MKGLSIIALSLAVSAHILPTGDLSDPALEARARELTQELRCVVCEDASIASSPAPLAADLRRLVRERIIAGDSDQGIRDLLTERYGEFVLYRPRFGLRTWALWLGPFLVALAAAAILLRRRRDASPEAPLSPAETKELSDLLDGKV